MPPAPPLFNERADAILAELAVTEDGRQALASRSGVLETGLDARLATLADTITSALSALAPAAISAADEALAAVLTHGRRRDRDGETRAATDAVRLIRWLATPEPAPGTLAEAATRMLRCWAWADRGLASEALPRQLAVATLATRLADLDHARAVIVESVRFEQ